MIDSRAYNSRLGIFVALTSKDIQDIAHLARLGVEQDALEPLAKDLSTVLALVEELQAIDTSNVQPMEHPASASLLLREDEVTESNRRDVLQAPAPSTEDGYFLVPRVIE
ncbi:MAG: Asp-tRNA(Asn)/Glu-tRNA(Gln) amidotransferase subunit GatC [Granulosicoccus sp.]